ncbi:thermonuclease family protein [Geitlerinema sp. PCC 9228]|jgi:micrococcal nuclease|uniref:thermonuclease family protein n=1 Tax=Geitlerinema sp. PCC 9228 TaxID=111611 RepID=UPI0008F9DAC3|nr:thermonuclease family protein [Geitlerinema sp. PCC 9228]
MGTNRQIQIALSTIAITIFLWLTACTNQSATTPMQVRVVRVVSGQTLEVLPLNSNQNASPKRVRLIGLDAPARRQLPWGPNAKQYLQALASEQTLQLEFDRQREDKYQRWLAYAWLDGTLINEQLLQQGHAIAVSRYPNTKYQQRFTHAREQARLLGRGIWNPEQPMRQTPAEFRRQNR